MVVNLLGRRHAQASMGSVRKGKVLPLSNVSADVVVIKIPKEVSKEGIN